MYYFIVNPSANRGHGEKVWRELERCLRNSEVEYEVWMTQSPGDAAGFARRLQKGNRDRKSTRLNSSHLIVEIQSRVAAWG